MNVLILNGSPRPNGNTKQMIDALEAEGIRIIYADFGSGKNDVFAYSYNESYTVVLTRHVLENFDTQMIKNMEYPQITTVAE